MSKVNRLSVVRRSSASVGGRSKTGTPDTPAAPAEVGPVGRFFERLPTPALLGLFGLGILSAGADFRGWATEIDLARVGPTLAIVSASVSLLATWLAYMRWRNDRDVVSGRLALAVPCLYWASQSISGPLLLGTSAERQIPSPLRIGAGLVGSWLVACDLIWRRRRMTRSFAAGFLLSVGSAIAIASAIKWGAGQPFGVENDVRRVISMVAFPALWIVLGFLTLVSARPPRTALRSCLGAALPILGAAQLIAPPGLRIEDAPRAAAAAGLGIASVLVLLGGLSYNLRQSYDLQRRRLVAVEFEAAEVSSRLEAEQLLNSCKAHDQKAALLSIEAVIRLLETSDAIDPGARKRLCSAATDELRRLRGYAPDRTETDLRELVEPIVALANAAGANVNMKIRPGLFVNVGVEFIDIVRNLISNAVRHGGNAPVIIEARRLDYEFVELYVTDRGPGITSARRFDLFAPGRSSGGEEGSGLGLHSARSLLRDMGGDLILDRSHAGGARFIARIPVLGVLTAGTPA